MEELLALKEIDWFKVATGITAAFLFFKFCVSSYEWLANRYGFETKKMREKREDHELLVATSKNLAELQKKHDKDESKLETCLASFIAETKKENDALRAEMKLFAQNRANDRQVSIDREKRLNGRIDDMAVCDKSRDEHIEHINKSLDKLTELFVNKEIEDIRWAILDFTASLSNGREYNLEAYNHIFKIYDKYERILEEYNLENGLVDASMKYVQEKYNEKLKR
jgi:hypothetical protein